MGESSSVQQSDRACTEWSRGRPAGGFGTMDRVYIRRQVLQTVWRLRVGDAEQRALAMRSLRPVEDAVWREEWALQGGWVLTAWIARIWRLACNQATSKKLFRTGFSSEQGHASRDAMQHASRPISRAVMESLRDACVSASAEASRLLLRCAPYSVRGSTPHLLEFARQAAVAPVLLESWSQLVAASPAVAGERRTVGRHSVESALPDPAATTPAHERTANHSLDDTQMFAVLRGTLERILEADPSPLRRLPLFPDDTDGLLALPTETPEQEYARLLASACVRHADTRAVTLLFEQIDRNPKADECMRTLMLLADSRQQQGAGLVNMNAAETPRPSSPNSRDRSGTAGVQAADLLRMEIAKRITDRFSVTLAQQYPEWIRIFCEWKCRTDHTLLQACADRALENACEELLGYSSNRLDLEVYLLSPEPTLARACAPLVDVVFVHGLRGDPLLTWRCGAYDVRKPTDEDLVEAPVQATAARKSMKAWQERLWPREWLAPDLGASARILSVGYSSALTAWGSSEESGATLSLSEQAADLRRKLLRAGVGKRPLVLVAHSYGGLIAKQLLVDDAAASAADTPGAGTLSRALRGIAFYSTPHHGSAVAGRFLGGILDKAVRPAAPVRELLPYNESIEKLHRAFLTLIRHPCRELRDDQGRTRLPGVLWGLWLAASAGQQQRDGSRSALDAGTTKYARRPAEGGAGIRSELQSTVADQHAHRGQQSSREPSRRQVFRERGDQVLDVLGPVSVGTEYVQGLLREEIKRRSAADDDEQEAAASDCDVPSSPAKKLSLEPSCILPPVQVLSIYEGTTTRTWGGSRFLFVSEESAYAGVGKLVRVDRADHLQVCKPPSREDVRYRSVLDMIQRIVQETSVWCDEC
jgi:hypothetical protein